MTEAVKKIKNRVGLPRIIISLFFIVICIMSIFSELSFSSLISDAIRRFAMWGILTLAMIPSIQSGTGPNFALPLGIICGLLGSLISIEIGLLGGMSFVGAILFSLPFSILAGWGYGLLLNKIKGSEMLVATYTGFSIVSFMSIMWILLPFKHSEMVWPIGRGLRVTISLDSTFGEILNNLWDFNIAGVKIPTGTLVSFLLCCLIVYIFTRTKTGLTMKVAGDNPMFATSAGINVDKRRVLGTILSTILGAIGIIVYSQSYGFIQLYEGPLMMAFPAVAAVLIGGASAQKAKIYHVILGTFLFQGLLTIALPVANQIFTEGNISEVLRMIIQNGIIIYALTKVGGAE